mgnify:CR=1 FL=1
MTKKHIILFVLLALTAFSAFGATDAQTANGNVRWGVTNNLTLTATANPDFSQVEADVAQLQYDPRQSLYFPEKRPFFIEGQDVFNFSYGGASNNNGFNWGNPDLFYTRRIGRAPQGGTPAADYVDRPDGVPILVDAAAEIRAIAPQVGLMLLSQHVEVHHALRLMTDFDGGVGYLLKDRVSNLAAFAADVRRVAGNLRETSATLGQTAETVQRNANLSRAYRVNLNVLALVALFTGGLLVFSTQALSIVRRRTQLALLRDGQPPSQARFPNDRSSVEGALSRLPAGTTIAVESTGSWWWFVETARRLGYHVVLSHPKLTKAIAAARLKSRLSKAITPTRDQAEIRCSREDCWRSTTTSSARAVLSASPKPWIIGNHSVIDGNSARMIRTTIAAKQNGMTPLNVSRIGLTVTLVLEAPARATFCFAACTSGSSLARSSKHCFNVPRPRRPAG